MASVVLQGVLVGACVIVPAEVGSGWLSDRFGGRGIYMLGAILLGGSAFVVLPLIDTGEFRWICPAIGGGQLFVSMMCGPQAALLAELFSADVRYSGASLGYQFGAIIGGGLAPINAAWLLASAGSTVSIAVCIAAACLITVASTLALKETYGRGLLD